MTTRKIRPVNWRAGKISYDLQKRVRGDLTDSTPIRAAEGLPSTASTT